MSGIAVEASRLFLVLSLLLACILSGSVLAYELATHEALSDEAFRRARIGARLPSYGLGDTTKLPGRRSPVLLPPRPAAEWVAAGGKDEDSPVDRVVHHFYDPHHDQGLTLPGGLVLGNRAPDWALEDRYEFVGQNHSYRDARQAFHAGLTLTGKASRDRELGHTFYALGHVIHLVQDLAAPEHARNDQHLIGKSFVEEYLKKNVEHFTPTDARLTPAAIPTVAVPRDLWKNAAGTGIAEFTNKHFVSADTNFTELRTGATAEKYPSPVLDLGIVDDGPVGACRDGVQPPGSPVPLIFYGNFMPDPVGPSLVMNPRTTTYSVLDQQLKARGKRPLFAINCFTVDAAASLLLPRAASYSAALLEYFFRGRPTVILGNGAFRVVNRTSTARYSHVMDGVFELYHDDGAGTRRLLSAWSLRLDPDQVSPALPTPLLADGQAARCMLVFRGQMGTEPGAVAGQVLDLCPTATTLAQPLVELGLVTGPGSGVSSAGCPEGYWRYLIELCCFPASPPHYGYYCATSPLAAVVACQSSTAWFFNCRFPS
jgi:hypothetical protein